ncbi:uncharacterized protein ACIQIH_017454 isoform 3-T6 [Cyanocitta cristata]
MAFSRCSWKEVAMVTLAVATVVVAVTVPTLLCHRGGDRNSLEAPGVTNRSLAEARGRWQRCREELGALQGKILELEQALANVTRLEEPGAGHGAGAAAGAAGAGAEPQQGPAPVAEPAPAGAAAGCAEPAIRRGQAPGVPRCPRAPPPPRDAPSVTRSTPGTPRPHPAWRGLGVAVASGCLVPCTAVYQGPQLRGDIPE